MPGGEGAGHSVKCRNIACIRCGLRQITLASCSSLENLILALVLLYKRLFAKRGYRQNYQAL